MNSVGDAEPRWSRNLRIVLHGGLLPLIGAAALLSAWRAYVRLSLAGEGVLAAADWLLLIAPLASVAATAVRPWRGKLAALLLPYAYMACVGAAYGLSLL